MCSRKSTRVSIRRSSTRRKRSFLATKRTSPRDGAAIRVADIGRAVKAPEDNTLAGWLNDKRAVLLAVQRSPGANVMATVAAIKKELPQLKASLPPDIDVEIVSDRTQTIQRASPMSASRCF